MQRSQGPSDDELGYESARDLRDRLSAGTLSPVELFDYTAARIEAKNSRLNALVYLALDEAKEVARAAEEQLRSGGEVPPLLGIPTAIKDLFDSKPGWPMTLGGVPALADNVGEFSCAWCERVERAGAVVVGKTNSPAFGFRAVTDNHLFGPTRNPFDLTRNAGGSSGGSAAAVAAGLFPFAEGTDAGGSIRIPAAWCGVFGHKPSFGLTPLVMRPNGFIGNSPYPSEGTLTRTVADAALLLDLHTGSDPRDPQASYAAPPNFLEQCMQGVRGLRIALSVDLGAYPVDREVTAAIVDCVQAFEDAGAVVEPVALDLGLDHAEITRLWQRSISALNVGALAQMRAAGLDLLADHRATLPVELVEWAEEVAALTTVDHNADAVQRTRLLDGVEAVLGSYDLLISATTATTATPNPVAGDHVPLALGPSEVNGVVVEPTIGWALTPVFNFTGHPAASVPAGLINGLPVGMQIAGRRYRDGQVLAAAKTIEDLRPWAATYRTLGDPADGTNHYP